MRSPLPCAVARLNIILFVGVLTLGFYAPSVGAFDDGGRTTSQRPTTSPFPGASVHTTPISPGASSGDLGVPAWAEPRVESRPSRGISPGGVTPDAPPDFPGADPVPIDDHIYLLVVAGLAYAAVRLSRHSDDSLDRIAV